MSKQILQNIIQLQVPFKSLDWTGNNLNEPLLSGFAAQAPVNRALA